MALVAAGLCTSCEQQPTVDNNSHKIIDISVLSYAFNFTSLTDAHTHTHTNCAAIAAWWTSAGVLRHLGLVQANPPVAIKCSLSRKPKVPIQTPLIKLNIGYLGIVDGLISTDYQVVVLCQTTFFCLFLCPHTKEKGVWAPVVTTLTSVGRYLM